MFDRTARGNRANPVFSSCPTGFLAVNQLFRKLYKTTVAVERTTFTKLDRLAKANNVSKMEFLTHAINYFEKYGINPVEHESPAQEMQKLIKRMDQVCVRLVKLWPEPAHK